MDEFLTVAEVAETLKLNQRTVRNWIDQGSLAALRIGRRVRIRREDFRALVEQSATSQRATAQRFDAQAFGMGSRCRCRCPSSERDPGSWRLGMDAE